MDAGTSGNRPEDRFDKELRSILEGDGLEARFKELSAEEREKHAKETQKLRKKALKQQRTARRRRRLRRSAWGLSTIVLVGACVFAYIRFGHSGGGPNDTATVTHGAVPSISATAMSPLTDSGPPSDPFQGTPADKWANGAAGIILPAAKPIGRYSATQVEDAYQTTKKLLIAAALDKQTLNGGAPTAFAKLLTQQQRNQFLGALNKIGLDKYGSAISTRGMIMQFAPGTTRFIGSVIKVHGSMSATATKDRYGQPVLRIAIDYLAVYPVEPPRAPADWMRVVAQFDGPVDFGDWQDAETPFEPWWSAGPAPAGGRCGMKDGYVHPDFPGGPQDSVRPSGPPENPYSFAKPSGVGCHTTTGT